MYNEQIHMRPAYTEIINGDEYRFHCSTTQADFYFFKFGKEAEVLSPQRLRELFRRKHADAVAVYVR
jgi:predicted DNA-binding transcriptional regulator YafY